MCRGPWLIPAFNFPRCVHLSDLSRNRIISTIPDKAACALYMSFTGFKQDISIVSERCKEARWGSSHELTGKLHRGSSDEYPNEISSDRRTVCCSEGILPRVKKILRSVLFCSESVHVPLIRAEESKEGRRRVR